MHKFGYNRLAALATSEFVALFDVADNFEFDADGLCELFVLKLYNVFNVSALIAFVEQTSNNRLSAARLLLLCN